MNRLAAFALAGICAVAVGAQAASGAVRAAAIDPGQSRVGFELKTRWGQALEGRFAVRGGAIAVLPDGRRQVSVVLSVRDMEIVGFPTYSRIARGEGFFDAARHPELSFVSQPYAESLVRAGGPLAGQLRIRGVERRETFTVEPAGCARPGVDCDAVAHGTVRRSDYGMDRWSFAIADRIRFSLRLRTHESVEGLAE